MKKYILAFITLAILATSCDDFLDKDPENSVNVEEVDYTQTENMFSPVSGVYAKARTENGFSRWALYGLIAVRADDTDKGAPASDQAAFNLCKEFKYSQITDFWALNASWQGLYELVLNCNQALTVLDKYAEHIQADADQKLYEQYTAEVRFLRAYGYFYLTRLRGDIPVVLDNNEIVNNPGKTPREAVYAFINSELEYCSAKLPALRPNEMPYKGQVTKYTALALKAKANADINNWDAVLEATNEVVNSGKFSLYTDYYQYFKKPGRLADESLFELQYTDFNQGSGEIFRSDNWFAFQGPGSIKGVNPMNGGWGFLTPSNKIVDLFVSRGETDRDETTFLRSNSTTREGDVVGDNLFPVYNGKAYLPSTQLTPGRADYGDGNNIRMLRYADVLLLNAEAKVRKGQNGDAPFNEVRTRANMPTLTGVTLEQILEERQVELACEWGERYFDLIRTDRAEGTLPGFVKGQSEYYPIPQEQIDLNPNLK